MPVSQFKEYLGDGVYADFEGYAVVLTTENGIETSNTIVCEPEVLDALNRYQVWLKEQFNQPKIGGK